MYYYLIVNFADIAQQVEQFTRNEQISKAEVTYLQGLELILNRKVH